MADIFVSYARADKARVAPLVAVLERQGWSVWRKSGKWGDFARPLGADDFEVW